MRDVALLLAGHVDRPRGADENGHRLASGPTFDEDRQKPPLELSEGVEQFGKADLLHRAPVVCRSRSIPAWRPEFTPLIGGRGGRRPRTAGGPSPGTLRRRRE